MLRRYITQTAWILLVPKELSTWTDSFKWGNMKRSMIKSASLVRCKAVLQILPRHSMTCETSWDDKVGALILGLFVLFLIGLSWLTSFQNPVHVSSEVNKRKKHLNCKALFETHANLLSEVGSFFNRTCKESQ